MGRAALALGDDAQAESLFIESLELYLDQSRDARPDPGLWSCLVALAELAKVKQQPNRAARLLGAVQALQQSNPSTSIYSPFWLAEIERTIAALHTQLDEVTFAAEWAEGQQMTLQQAHRIRVEVAVISRLFPAGLIYFTA